MPEMACVMLLAISGGTNPIQWLLACVEHAEENVQQHELAEMLVQETSGSNEECYNIILYTH